MIDIYEEKIQAVTFNFFKNDNCTAFKFCHSYKVKTDDVIALTYMTPEKRLAELKQFLEKGDKGKSCEFHYNGRFWMCGNVKEKVEGSKEKAKKMLKARKN